MSVTSMKTNIIRMSIFLSALSASGIASSLSTVYSTDLMGFTGFLNVLLHIGIALAPLFVVIGLINLTHYIYIGKRQNKQTSFSENMPVATSISSNDSQKRSNRASSLAPPPIRNSETDDLQPHRERVPFQAHLTFLNSYDGIKKNHARIVNLHARIKNSDMSAMLKTRADELKASSDKAIDALRSIDKVAPATDKNVSDANLKLVSVIDALSGVVEQYQEVMSSEFDNIKIPDTYKQQDELEKLRAEGRALLARIQNDSNFDTSEDRFRLDKIVNERLDQVWRDYTAAKRKHYAAPPSNRLLITDQRSSQDPDAALDTVFNEIKSIYSDIEIGVRSSQRDTTMKELMVNKNYFENR